MISTAIAAPKATATVVLKANLDACATVPGAWDPANPTATSNFSSTVTVYDSLGAAHATQIFFRNTGTGWEWHAMADGSNLTGGMPGSLQTIATGTLTFDADGALAAYTQASTFNPIGATNPQALHFDFGDPTLTGGTGIHGVTQFASVSASDFVGQDGFASGQLASIQVAPGGKIVGVFSNGQARTLARVVLALFPEPSQLTPVGDSRYRATLASGAPCIGTAGVAGLASVVSGALESLDALPPTCPGR